MTLFKITTLLRDFEQNKHSLRGKRINEFYVIALSETQAVELMIQEWNRLGLRHNGRADIIAINNLACRAEDQNAKYILVQQPTAQFVADPFFPVDTTKPAFGQYSGRLEGRPLPPEQEIPPMPEALIDAFASGERDLREEMEKDSENGAMAFPDEE